MSNVPDAGATQRAVRRTGEADAATYYRNRYWTLVTVLHGAGYPWELAAQVSRVILPQLSLETAHGVDEWNYNIGNIKGSTAYGQHLLTDGQYYRSYPSLAEGIADYLKLITRGRYRAAWDTLLRGGYTSGTQWYQALMLAGYNPFDPVHLTEWTQIDGRIARLFGGTT